MSALPGKPIQAVTDADGKFQVTGLSAGEFTLFVRESRSRLRKTLQVSVEDDQTVEVDITLETAVPVPDPVNERPIEFEIPQPDTRF